MRKILFKKGTNDRHEYPFSGFFHQWIDEDGKMYAVIEVESGKIEKVHFALVKFAEPYREAKSTRCEKCEDRGWIYNDGGGRTTCPCHY